MQAPAERLSQPPYGKMLEVHQPFLEYRLQWLQHLSPKRVPSVCRPSKSIPLNSNECKLKLPLWYDVNKNKARVKWQPLLVFNGLYNCWDGWVYNRRVGLKCHEIHPADRAWRTEAAVLLSPQTSPVPCRTPGSSSFGYQGDREPKSPFLLDWAPLPWAQHGQLVPWGVHPIQRQKLSLSRSPARCKTRCFYSDPMIIGRDHFITIS